MSNCTCSTTKIINQLKEITSIIPQKAYIHLQVANDFVLPIDWGFTDRINTNYHVAFIKSGNV